METLLPSKFVSHSDAEERKARQSELLSLEAYRLRLEHEARVADELARIDVLARRLSSRPPAMPVAAFSAPPPAMSSGQLPLGDASSGSWPALSMDVVVPDEREAGAAPARLSLIAAAVAVSALLSFAGLAFVLGPSSPSLQPAKTAAAAQPAAQAVEPTVTAHATCGTDPKPAEAAVIPAVTPAVTTTAQTASPVSVAPATRTAKRGSHAPRTTTPAASPSPAAAPKAPATPDMDQAARTAQMLREQLGTSLH